MSDLGLHFCPSSECCCSALACRSDFLLTVSPSLPVGLCRGISLKVSGCWDIVGPSSKGRLLCLLALSTGLQNKFCPQRAASTEGAQWDLSVCSEEGRHIGPAVALVTHAVVGSLTAQNSVELEQVSRCSDSVCTTELTLFFPLIDSLSDNAAAFSKRAKHLRRQMWWRDCKVSKKGNRQGWGCGRMVTCLSLGGGGAALPPS